MASNNGLMRLKLVILSNIDLIKDRDNEDSSFTHARLCLAKNILTLKCMRDSINLNLTWVLETTLSNPSLEIIFQEKLIPTRKVSTKLAFTCSLVRNKFFLILIWAMIIIIWNVHDSYNLNITQQKFKSYFFDMFSKIKPIY